MPAESETQWNWLQTKRSSQRGIQAFLMRSESGAIDSPTSQLAKFHHHAFICVLNSTGQTESRSRDRNHPANHPSHITEWPKRTNGGQCGGSHQPALADKWEVFAESVESWRNTQVTTLSVWNSVRSVRPKEEKPISTGLMCSWFRRFRAVNIQALSHQGCRGAVAAETGDLED